MRIIGMDIHRVAAEVVGLLDGQLMRLGRIPMARDCLEAFARKELTHDDHVIVEATGNAAAVVEVLAPYVSRVVIANPKQVRLIAHAKIKTDAIDAAVWRSCMPPDFSRRFGCPTAALLPCDGKWRAVRNSYVSGYD